MTLGQVVPKLDALHLMDGIEGLRSLPKHSVDMLLTDPPYGTTRNFWDVPLPLPELWEAVRWAVKPNGAILFFAQCPFDKMLGASNLAMLRYEWVWYKSRATGFLNANRAPLKKSENILVFYQKSPVYHPQFTYGEPYRKTNPRSGCSTNYGKFERTGSESSDGRRYPGNVLFVPTVTGGIHPTQKPVELCEYFIKTYTRPGEIVADICAGSATTAVAAALWLGAAMLKTLVLLNRTVPLRVGEQPCHIPKVHHDKVCLALLFSDTGSSSDHLFERGHALHSLIKNNELGHLAVCAGGKQFRCGCNHGIWFGYRDEIVKFGLAVHI
mgnify:CR=1 FL=1